MENYIIVHELAGSRIVVECNNMQLRNLLISLGFETNGEFYIKQIIEEERIEIIKTLIKNDALFSEGNDWSPVELLLYYREQGFFNGKFKSISWINFNTYSIVEK
jgi:hypothetical protein